MSDEQWGVWVDEGKINATGVGANWWAEVSTRMTLNGVLIALDIVAIVGGTQFMRCDSREDAEFAASHIAEHTHRTVVEPMTLATARKKVRTRHTKRSDHADSRSCMYCRPEES